jgi:signal transduction histidine kinase
MNTEAMTPIDVLRSVPIFAHLPDEKLAWVANNGTTVDVPAGAIHANEGEPVEHLHVVLEGALRISKKVDGQEVIINTFEPGTFFGEVPLLAGTPFVASGRALRPTRIFKLEEFAFRKLLVADPVVGEAVLGTMAQRVRVLQSIALEREKLTALGTLAAGLAHELNNPASAGRRAAERLRERIVALPQVALGLSQAGLTSAQVDALAQLVRKIAEHAGENAVGATPPLDPLAQSEREDEVGAWLEEHGVEDGWQFAPTFVEMGLDSTWLDDVAHKVPAGALPHIVRYLDATLTLAELAREIAQSTTRISALVAAVESYTYLDRAPQQEIDIHEGLESTLTILHSKLRDGVTVIREYGSGVPRICAYGAELNQVWTNLIDNALDAIEQRGTIHVRTTCEKDRVLVEIADDGPGIPQEIQGRIWEPFFTTKGVGAGTGLGLDVSYRIVVGRHGGDIRVVSEPGNTRFQVRLPIGGN